MVVLSQDVVHQNWDSQEKSHCGWQEACGRGLKFPAISPAAVARKEFEGRLNGGKPEETIAALNELVGAWYMSHQTPLTSLDQLVKAGLLFKLPTAPDGQRYAIDPSKGVVLTNN
jgi:hypothetical protein